MVSILNAFKSHLAFDDFILEAWLLPLMYPGTPWCRFFAFTCEFSSITGFAWPWAVNRFPALSMAAPTVVVGLLDSAATAAAPR